jgi:crossover junction endodeoxyribonuclease RusA
MTPITLTLPYPISANRYWRAVIINKHAMMVPTKEAKDYKATVGWMARAAGIRKPIMGRVAVSYVLYPQRPQDFAKRMRLDPLGWDDTVQCLDLDNAQKVLFDALKGVVIEDDKWVRRIVADRAEPDGEARMVVTI